jgi:RNA polymerase sigma-70 factor, ECF subfamily
MNPAALQQDPEQAVIEAIQQGDPEALAEFMHRQGSWVRSVIFGAVGRTDEIDDIAQRVWMQVWRQARRLEDPLRWRPWLYHIARNAALDAARSRTRRRKLLGGWLERRKAASVSAVDAAVVLDERQKAMHEAIAELPALYREPFVLKHLEGWSYAQIAEALSAPVDTIETRLVRARRLLRERLKGRL